VELKRTHHLVLYCAFDGLELATVVLGMDLVIGSGESFTLVPPVPPENARQATLELLEAGAISVSHFDHETGEGRDLDPVEARRTLADPATWDLKASPPVAYAYEIGLTAAGEELYAEAHRLFAEEMEPALEEARVRDAEFMRRHPDFVKKNARYLQALSRWVERGGPEPERPRFD
jgi:hypothetical protein